MSKHMDANDMKRAGILPSDPSVGAKPLDVSRGLGAELNRGKRPANDAKPGPIAGDPLRGLEHLGPIALLGRDRILAVAALPVAYVWQDIAPAGTVVLLCGPPAEGKTTLLFKILGARAGAHPMDLLCRRIEPAPAGRYVVLIEGEHSEASTARKLRRTLQLLGVDDSALDRIIVVARKAVQLGSPAWLDVVRMISAGLVSDVGLDTLARVAPAEANDEREQVAIFDAIARACEAAPEGSEKPVMWCVAHTRKGDVTGLDAVSGSTQRVGQADTVLLVTGEKIDGRTVSSTVTFAKLREDPDDYPLPVTFSIVDDASAEGGKRLVTRAGAKVDDGVPLETRILDLLAKAPQSKTGLRKALGRNPEDVEAALSNLFGARQIVSRPGRVNGQACKVFQLREDGSEKGEPQGEPR